MSQTHQIHKSAQVILFDNQPRLTHADRKRLSPHLTGWNRLSSILAADLTSEDDLKRLVLIEYEGKRRKPIVKKLLGYLHSSQRKRVTAAFCHVGT